MFQRTTLFFFAAYHCIIKVCFEKQCRLLFGFCDIQNNQGLGKGYQPQPSASADNRYLDLDYSEYHKNLI